MTVPYSVQVGTSFGIGNFYKVLTIWHGSIYKMLWRDFLLYVILYVVISAIYRNVLKDDPDYKNQEQTFREIVLYFRENNSRIPIIFVLSFYVSILNGRWWAKILLIPFPDQICLQVSVLILGQDRRGRLLRRAVARYVVLSEIIAFALLSEHVKLRFPNLDSYCDAGLMLPHEVAIMKSLTKNMNYPTYYVPIIWAANLIYRAKREGRILTEYGRTGIIKLIDKFRGQLMELLNQEIVMVPLAYTQVSTIAVYTYFLVAVLGNQFVKDPEEIDIYFPVFGFLEFIFFVGWLKVAESMLNPFGDDDDDFELNFIIDRNIQVAFLMVDEIHRAVPATCRDYYHETVLRKPFYVAKRRPDGTFDNEVRPPGAAPEPTKKKPQTRSSVAQAFFELYNSEEQESLDLFKDLLTRPSIVFDETADDEEADDEDVESIREDRLSTESIMSTRFAEELRRVSELEIRPKYTTNAGRRLSLEGAAPGTYRSDARQRSMADDADDEPLASNEEDEPENPTGEQEKRRSSGGS